MQNTRIIKRRIKSAKNISQITKALQMVAASKMKRAQEKALSTKPYAQKVWEIIQSLQGKVDSYKEPLLRMPKEVKATLYILISSNKGLCGSINTNLFRLLDVSINGNHSVKVYFITLGVKGQAYATLKGELMADFSQEVPFEKNTYALTKIITQSFVSRKFDQVFLVYNDFISALNQKPRIKRILPIVSDEILYQVDKEGLVARASYALEPSAGKLLSFLLPFYLEIQIQAAIYEAEASEHSARMLAMRNATDNASQLIYGLTLEYNKIRQQAITNEISDIVTAKISLEE